MIFNIVYFSLNILGARDFGASLVESGAFVKRLSLESYLDRARVAGHVNVCNVMYDTRVNMVRGGGGKKHKQTTHKLTQTSAEHSSPLPPLGHITITHSRVCSPGQASPTIPSDCIGGGKSGAAALQPKCIFNCQ